MEEENKKLSFIERMKQRATSQQTYGGKSTETTAETASTACPNCGASRAKQDGLTQCAYCGHAFINTTLTDGHYIKKSDNSNT
jgi:DNA-directed RNA polymerase subunit RPC12/RpoP